MAKSDWMSPAPFGTLQCPTCGRTLTFLQRVGEIYIYECPDHGTVAQWPGGAMKMLRVPDAPSRGRIAAVWFRLKAWWRGPRDL